MGFRFRKSIKIAPGVRINISKKGVSSVSLGGHGTTVNIGGKGVKTTVGVPGTGISYTTNPGQSGKQSPGKNSGTIFIFIVVIFLIAALSHK